MTSEDPNTLQKYHRLGVQEVWIWKGNQLQINGLRSDGYELIERSEFLPGLDIVCLTECIQIPDPMEALDRFEAELDRQSKLK
jgi:Uma2 family endonuclease